MSMEEREIAVNGILPTIIARMEEKQKVMKEMLEVLRASNSQVSEADRERWEREKEAHAAAGARVNAKLLARLMKKMKKPLAL